MSDELDPQVLQVVTSVIAAEFHVDKGRVTPQSHLTRDFKADSLEAFEVLIRLEGRFNLAFRIDDDELATVEQIVRTIMLRRAQS